MRRIVIVGTLALGLAALMWVTNPISAQKGGHGGGGGHAGGGGHVGGGGGGHAAVHTGSVHYGGHAAAPVRAAPVRAAPAAHYAGTGSVHYAGAGGRNYAGAGSREGYRNPYRDDYFRHFRAGYRPFYLDGAQYYGYDDLPVGFQVVVINGITYYVLDGIYYQAYISGGQTVYLVVPSPV